MRSKDYIYIIVHFTDKKRQNILWQLNTGMENIPFIYIYICDLPHKKTDAAHEPECSHVKHFCETSELNSLVHFSPVTVPAHCRL